MNTTVFLLSGISLTTLLLGLFTWRLTSSKPIIFYSIFASVAFLLTAYGIATKQAGQLTFIMPFLVTMLLAGRALGVYWRTFFKGESELRMPAHLLGGAVAICTLGTCLAFFNQ